MGRDKAQIEVGGVTLIEHALRVVSAVTPDVRLACGPEERYTELGVPLVKDRVRGAGPMAGLEAGLAAAPAGRVVVLACDMPRADENVLRALLDHAEVHDLDVVAVRSERGVEPLCAVWSTSLLPAVRAALGKGERSVHRFIASLPRAAVLDAAAIGCAPDFAANVNTPADLERARAAVANRAPGGLEDAGGSSRARAHTTEWRTIEKGTP